jgi:hypothetical protein
MFFSIFWTAYIPFAIVIASAGGRSLKKIFASNTRRRTASAFDSRSKPAALARGGQGYARLRR